MADIQGFSIFEKNIALTPAQQMVIVKEFWPVSNSSLSSHDNAAVTAFFSLLNTEVSDIKHHRERFAVETLDGIVSLVQTLKSSGETPMSDLIQGLSKRFFNFDEKAIQRSLELTIRLWLTINVNSPSLAVGSTFPLEMPLTWESNVSLREIIQGRWGRQHRSRHFKPGLKIDDTLTAAYLVNICGMTLQWTNYLTDHLTADPQRKVLTVYKHKVFLLNRLKYEESGIIPKDVLEEALDTLNLLFPFGDPATKQLLTRHGLLAFYRLGNCNRDRELDPIRYSYWKEELDTLVDLYNRPPRTWKQLATDRRNLMEWAAFWVTIMVAVLTMVSIPCNLIQATYSVKAYQVALAQGNGIARL